MVLFVPMLTIALILVSSQSIIRDQILRASQNTLNQFFRRVDDVLDEAQNVCVNFVESSDSKLWSKKIMDQFDRRAFYAGKVQEQLKSYAGEKYLDIFAYYPEKDYVVSANYASMNLESYYRLYYGSSGKDFWELRSAVSIIVLMQAGTRISLKRCLSGRWGLRRMAMTGCAWGLTGRTGR